MAQDASVRDRHGHSSKSPARENKSGVNGHSNDFGLPYTTALTLTAALGVTLLLLNMLVLAAVHYRKNNQQKNQRNLSQSLPHSGISPSHCGTLHSSTTLRSLACTQDWPPEYTTCFPENAVPPPELQPLQQHQPDHIMQHQQQQQYDQHFIQQHPDTVQELQQVTGKQLWQQQQQSEHLMEQHHQQQQHLMTLTKQHQTAHQHAQQLQSSQSDNLPYHAVPVTENSNQDGLQMFEQHLHNKANAFEGTTDSEEHECTSERHARIKTGSGSSTLKRASIACPVNSPSSSTLKRNAQYSSSLRRKSCDVKDQFHATSTLNRNQTDTSTLKRNANETFTLQRNPIDTSTFMRHQTDSSTIKRNQSDTSTLKRKHSGTSNLMRSPPMTSPVGGATIKIIRKPSPPPRSSSVPSSETVSLQGDANELS